MSNIGQVALLNIVHGWRHGQRVLRRRHDHRGQCSTERNRCLGGGGWRQDRWRQCHKGAHKRSSKLCRLRGCRETTNFQSCAQRISSVISGVGARVCYRSGGIIVRAKSKRQRLHECAQVSQLNPKWLPRCNAGCYRMWGWLVVRCKRREHVDHPRKRGTDALMMPRQRQCGEELDLEHRRQTHEAGQRAQPLRAFKSTARQQPCSECELRTHGSWDRDAADRLEAPRRQRDRVRRAQRDSLEPSLLVEAAGTEQRRLRIDGAEQPRGSVPRDRCALKLLQELIRLGRARRLPVHHENR
mmetsp:Transcript_878/g.2388  ORF Transcript_878/g.2388 Transcript_878/m.2388 type:complete len:299 (+) Transcript_878:2784-3680(+)